MGASTAFKTAVRSSITDLISNRTLIDLTNQRSAESGTDPTAIVEAVLTTAINISSAEVVEALGSDVADDDYIAIKFAMERAIQDLAQSYAVNLTPLGISAKEDTLRRMDDVRRHRVAAANSVKVTRNNHGYGTSPSGYDPFGGR